MFVFEPHRYNRMAEKPESHASFPIPMVYERVAPEPARWEYHILQVDTREASLPDEEQLSTLGRVGWIMTGLLDERMTGRGSSVYYYFMRQIKD